MQPKPSRRDLLPAACLCAALALLAAFVYAPTAGNGFVNFDDPEYVSRNPVVRRGLTLEGLAWSLTTAEQGNWHPLTWWSHMLDVSLFGLRPGAHHLVSALLHAAGAIVLLLALRRMTGRLWPSALVAALFAAHPLHVESVAWIAERKDVLCGLFWALALLAHARHARRPSPGRLAAVAACGVFALAAKPMAVTLPLTLLIADWWPLGRLRGAGGGAAPGRAAALVREKLPLLAAALLVGCLTLVLQARSGAMKTVTSHPVDARLANSLVSTATYPLKLLWPADLGMFYPFPAAGVPASRWLAAAALLAAVTLAAVALARRQPWLAAGWFWYLLTLAPVSGVVQVGEQARADRYAYVPSVGLTVALAWGVAAAARRPPALRAAASVAGAAAVLALALAARAQAGRWRDSETLFRHTLAVAGESSLLRTNLGGSLLEDGRPAEALRELRTALAANPRDLVAWFNAGAASLLLGRHAEAERAFRTVVEADPADTKALLNVGVAVERQGRGREALAVYRDVVRADPGDAAARYSLGALAAALGDPAEAGRQLAALEALGAPEARALRERLAAHGLRFPPGPGRGPL